jgi:protease-4
MKMPKRPNRRRDKCAAQHFGVWLCEPQWFTQAVAAVKDGTWKAQAVADEEGDTLYTMLPGGIATIAIHGQLTKNKSSFGGASATHIKRAIRLAKDDRGVRAIALDIDCPGGRADCPAGIVDALGEFKQAGKRVFAVVTGMCCSAGYWIAAAAERIYAGRTDMVGCIGAYAVLIDDRGRQEQIGIKAVLVKTGRYKGLGADGAVTEDLVEDVQRELNDIMEPFLADVAAGRKLDIQRVRDIADGRSHVGAKAVELGLVDSIASPETALTEITDMTNEEFVAYAAANPDAVKQLDPYKEGFAAGKAEAEAAAVAAQPKPATVAELRAAFPDSADSGFVIDQIDAKATIDQAKAAYADVLVKRLAEARQSVAAMQAQVNDLSGKLAEVTGGQAAVPFVPEEPKVETIEDPAARANAEWEKNVNDCRDRFISQTVYVKARVRELARA